jgi:YndJ-like protein
MNAQREHGTPSIVAWAGGWRFPAGCVVWMVLAAGATSGLRPQGLIATLFLLAPLLVVPLGFRLIEPTPLLRIASVLQPAAALLTAAAFWPSPGPLAAALTGPWLVTGGLAAFSGVTRLARHPWRWDEATCEAAAVVYLAVGAGWFLASRLGSAPLGFGEPIVLLTAVHFHFAGFAAPLLAAATLRCARRIGRPPRALERFMVAGIVAGPALVAAGFLISDAVRLGATLILAFCLCLLALQTGRCVPHIASRRTRSLLRLSSWSVIVAMLLAFVYACGEAAQVFIVNIPQMARWHGAVNAVGFALCGLLGWNLERTGKAVGSGR